MYDKFLGVNVIESTNHLLEEVLGVILLELTTLPYVAQEVTSLAEFHHKAHVLAGLKRII